MAQFIALAARAVNRFSQAEIEALLGPEADRVSELYAAGVLRTIFSRKDVPGAILVLEAADRAAASAAIESLPLRRNGMLDVELIEIAPYRGFCPPT